MTQDDKKEVATQFILAINEAYLRLCRKTRRSPHDLLRECGMERAQLLEKKYVDWATFQPYQERLESAVGEGQRIPLQLEINQTSKAIYNFRRVLAAVADPMAIYKGIWTWMGPKHFPVLDTGFEVMPGSRFRFWLRLPESYDGSIAYFKNVVASQVVLPTLLDLPFSDVEFQDIGSHHVECILKVPASRSIWSQTRRVWRRWRSRFEGPSHLQEFSEDLIASRTELRQRQEDLKELERRLENQQSLAVLGELAASVAHQVNTPLTVILNDLQFLLSSLDPERDRQVYQQMQQIVGRTSKLGKTVESLVSMARGQTVASKPERLDTILSQALELCRLKAQKKQVTLRPFEATDASGLLYPEIELTQVLVNLISNSIDAAGEKVDGWVEVSLHKQSDTALIAVLDSGLIANGNLGAEIMQPFFTTKPDGTGLGLSICQKLLKILGGILRQNLEGPHTCFEVVLPFPESREDMETLTWK